MSFSSDLLEQGRQLARKEPRKPKQASLRRSVSAAYYSLFHFLCEESAKALIGGTSGNSDLRAFARRSVAHSCLKAVFSEFSKPTPGKVMLRKFWHGEIKHDPIRIVRDSDVALICAAFLELQENRHLADYDFFGNMTRQDACDACDKAEAAMDAWRNLKTGKPEVVKLLALSVLLWPGISGRA